MSNVVSINKAVNLDWVVGNLGSSFLEDDQPDCLEIIEDESEVSIRFEGTGETTTYGKIGVEIETPDGEKANGFFPAMTTLEPKEGWLIFTLCNGTIAKRRYEHDYYDKHDDYQDWVVIPLEQV